MLELPWQAVPLTITWTKAGTSRSAGQSLSGVTGAIGTGSGFWKASVEMLVRGPEATLAWRAFYAAIDGMATPFLAPVSTVGSGPRPRDINGKQLGSRSVAGMAGSANSEGWGYAQEEPEIARTIGNASLRNTRLTIRHQHVPALRPGHYFGIGERLYLIKSTWSLSHSYPVQTGGVMKLNDQTMTLDDEVMQLGLAAAARDGDDVQAIEFWPHLRGPVPHDTPLILGTPKCRMMMASDDIGALTHNASRQRVVSFDMVEAI